MAATTFFLARGMERKENGAVYRVQSPENVGCIRSRGSGAEGGTSARLAFESALCWKQGFVNAGVRARPGRVTLSRLCP